MTRRVVPLVLSIAFALFTARFGVAQRGGGHGGAISGAHFGAGQFGTGSRGSAFSPSLSRSPQIFRPPSLSSPSRSFGSAPLRSGAYSSYRREPYRNHGNSGRYPLPYFYGYGSYLVPNVVGYPFGYDSFFDDDDFGYDQSPSLSQPTPPPQETYAPPEDYGPQPGPYPGAPYPGPNEEPSAGYRSPYQNSGQSEPPAAQPATALIFQDGRPRELVHNYVLTKTTLYDLDADSRKDIPLADLNLPATIAANHSAGIEFSLPTSY